MVTMNNNIVGHWKFRGVGDKGLLRKYCDAKMELQTVGSGGGGGGGLVNKMSS